jgi:hypothetical protein
LENKINVHLYFLYIRIYLLSKKKATNYLWQKHLVFAIVGMKKKKLLSLASYFKEQKYFGIAF